MIALRSSMLCASFWMAKRTHLNSSSVSKVSEWRDLTAAAISATSSSRSCFDIATIKITPIYKDDAAIATPVSSGLFAQSKTGRQSGGS
jgi:hypothetical protein